MKYIVCEVCGGSDILKDNGVFICQLCGCKYSLEEVKKMIAESDSFVQGRDVSTRDNQTDEYKSILMATRDAMVDGRFDSAYSNSIRLLAMRPDVPELVAIQALAILGKERISVDVPTSCNKGMERFYSMFDKWTAEYSEKMLTIKNVKSYLNEAYQTQSAMLREERTQLESQKYSASITDNLGAIGDALGMIGGNLYSTVHGMSVERDGRRRDEENRIIDKQIDRVTERIRKLDEFRDYQINRLTALSRALYEKGLESESPSEQTTNTDRQSYRIIDDEKIQCCKCGSTQPMRRIQGICWKCGNRFSD